jgi:hypothetical protein
MTFLIFFATLVPRATPSVAPRGVPTPTRPVAFGRWTELELIAPARAEAPSVPAAPAGAHAGPAIDGNSRQPRLVCRWRLDGTGRLVASWVAEDFTTRRATGGRAAGS